MTLMPADMYENVPQKVANEWFDVVRRESAGVRIVKDEVTHADLHFCNAPYARVLPISGYTQTIF
jgi:hypothetical protein